MRVEPLDPSKHNRGDFDCGRPELNDWLLKHAGQAQTRNQTARTFVLTEDGTHLIGYYSLTAHAVDVDDVSAKLARGQLRSFPIPAVLLARLAVAANHQGQGLGERLLADAVRRVVLFAQNVAVALLVVDALDDRAASFYEKYGFERGLAGGLRLFARLKDISLTFGASST